MADCIVTTHELSSGETELSAPAEGLAPLLIEVDATARPTVAYIVWGDRSDFELDLSAEAVGELLEDEG